MSRRKRRRDRTAAADHRVGPGVVAAPPADRLRPWLLGAAVVLLVARVLNPSETPAETGDGLPVVMLWIAVAVIWMLGAVGRRRFPVRLGWIDAAVFGLVGWHTLAAVVGASRGSPRPAINMLWEWIGLGLGYFLVRQFLATRREARAIVVVMIALAVGISGYGLYQVFYSLPQTVAVYRENPEKALREAGQPMPKDSPQRVAFDKRLESREPLATFALTNSLAGYLAPWLIVATGMAVLASHYRFFHGEPRVAWRTLFGVGCACTIILVCLILTKSRSAYLATLAGLVLLGACWIRPRLRTGRLLGGRWKLPVVLVLAGATLVGGTIAGAVAVGGLDVQVVSEAGKSLGYRVQYWQSTLRMIADHPWFGCGPGNFQREYTRYKLPEASEEVADPHNFLLEVWATAGTPALAALLAVLGTLAWTLWRRRATWRPPDARPETPPFDETPPPSSPRDDAAVHVLAGGAAGFVLAVPIGWISTAGPMFAAMGVGLPLAAGAAALLWPWIDRGWMSVCLPAVGLVVLLINLLAAGGIGFPGVAGTLWLLVVLTLDAAGADDRRELPWVVAMAGLALAIVLAVACHGTAYNPVLQSRAAMSQALGQRLEMRRRVDPADSPQTTFRQLRQSRSIEALLHRAAEHDRFAAAPWHELASIELERWLAQPDANSKRLDQFEAFSRRALELAPNSASLWETTGKWYLDIARRLGPIAERTGDEASRRRMGWALERARDHYRRAVALYPTSALLRADLAQSLLATGDREGFRREAEEALRLSDATPHADKKLPDELRESLSRSLSRR